MRSMLEKVLRRYGQTVVLCREGGEETIVAFMQPAAENQEKVPSTVTSIGWLDRRRWLYLGQAELHGGDRVNWENKTLRVRSSRPYYIGDQLTHWWAMLEEAREAAQ